MGLAGKCHLLFFAFWQFWEGDFSIAKPNFDMLYLMQQNRKGSLETNHIFWKKQENKKKKSQSLILLRL